MFTIESKNNRRDRAGLRGPYPSAVACRRPKRRSVPLPFILLCLLALFVAACDSSDGGSSPQQTTYGGTRINGFGSAANHVHALLVLSQNVQVLATHYGLFRTANAGESWTAVGGLANLPMDGLMTDSLSASAFNSNRLYVLTQPALTNHAGILGIYTSADQGITWQMGESSDSLGGLAYTVQAGNANADEVYTYIPTKTSQGLMVSEDDGKHFTSTGLLPFGRILGVLVVPGAPHHLLIYSSEGIARSEDGGIHWQVIPVPGNSKSIFYMVTGGPKMPIYASGDNGIYASTDEGKTFTLVNPNATYSYLKASPTQPQTLYGRTGISVYWSSDGGKSWQELPNLPQAQSTTSGRLEYFTPDPTHASVLYLLLSYPCGVLRYDQSSGKWTSLTPN
jgi:BNR/Asp-box repeat